MTTTGRKPRETSRTRPLFFACIIAAIVLGGGVVAAYLEALATWSQERDDIAQMARLEDDPEKLADGEETMQLSNYVIAKTQIVKHGAQEGEAGCIDRLVDRVGSLMGPDGASEAIQRLCQQKHTVGHVVNESPRLVVLRPRFDAKGNHIATEVTVVQTKDEPGVFEATLAPSVLIALFGVTLIAGFTAYELTIRSQRRYAALWEAATVDGLTGCLRREVFLATLSGAIAEAHGSGGRLSLLLADLDDLKTVNDRHGHAGGDTAIRLVASELRRGLRAGTVVGRLGGDEFAVLLAGSSLADAVGAAERVRGSIAAARGTGPDEDVAVTVSIGVAELARGEDAAALMARADAALYAAKQADRNRVERSER